MEKITEALDKAHGVDIIYLDLPSNDKAFDKVPHKRPLKKHCMHAVLEVKYIGGLNNSRVNDSEG